MKKRLVCLFLTGVVMASSAVTAFAAQPAANQTHTNNTTPAATDVPKINGIINNAKNNVGAGNADANRNLNDAANNFVNRGLLHANTNTNAQQPIDNNLVNNNTVPMPVIDNQNAGVDNKNANNGLTLGSGSYFVQDGQDLWLVSGNFKAKLEVLLYQDPDTSQTSQTANATTGSVVGTNDVVNGTANANLLK